MSQNLVSKLAATHKKIAAAYRKNKSLTPAEFADLHDLMADQLEDSAKAAEESLQIRSLEAQVRNANRCFYSCEGAMSGDIQIDVGDDENIAAATLNAAAASALTLQFGVKVGMADGFAHLICKASLDLTPGEAVADADVGAPSAAATVSLAKGSAIVSLTPDTDSGATKTYAPGDSFTVQVAFPGNSWLGQTVAAATKTFNVV